MINSSSCNLETCLRIKPRIGSGRVDWRNALEGKYRRGETNIACFPLVDIGHLVANRREFRVEQRVDDKGIAKRKKEGKGESWRESKREILKCTFVPLWWEKREDVCENEKGIVVIFVIRALLDES